MRQATIVPGIACRSGSADEYFTHCVPHDHIRSILESPDTKDVAVFSDNNSLAGSFSEHLHYMCTSLHSAAAREGSLTADSPDFSKLRITQTSIEAERKAGESDIAASDTTPSVIYRQDDNTRETDLKRHSQTGAGFDIIAGIKLLCYCAVKPGCDEKTSHACGGVGHSAEAVKQFFLTKLLANFKDERSVAYITGGVLLTKEMIASQLTLIKLDALLPSITLSIAQQNRVPLQIAANVILPMVLPSIVADIKVEAMAQAEKEHACYMDGLNCIREGISLFNESRDARGFRAELSMHKPSPELPTEVPGYTITVSKASS